LTNAGSACPTGRCPTSPFESRINDLEAVIDAGGFDRFALLGMSQGGPTAIAYAVRHPSGSPGSCCAAVYTASLGPTKESAELEDAFTRMIEVGWARPEGSVPRVFTTC
jgi:pimeloyl-ACP methyl ester carboxylesterase